MWVEWSGCGWNGLGVGGMVWVWVEWSGCGTSWFNGIEKFKTLVILPVAHRSTIV